MDSRRRRRGANHPIRVMTTLPSTAIRCDEMAPPAPKTLVQAVGTTPDERAAAGKAAREVAPARATGTAALCRPAGPG